MHPLALCTLRSSFLYPLLQILTSVLLKTNVTRMQHVRIRMDRITVPAREAFKATGETAMVRFWLRVQSVRSRNRISCIMLWTRNSTKRKKFSL